MAGHRATQSCCLGQIYGDFAICKGHRCIVVDILLGLGALHVEGMWTSAAGVSKTMTYVKCRREGFNTGWAVFFHITLDSTFFWPRRTRCSASALRPVLGLGNRNLPRAHLALTHPTPLYQHRLANAGEYKMSEVSRKIELRRRIGPASLQALLAPYPNWPSSIVKLGFCRLLLRRYGGATSSLLKGHGPYRSLGDECRI
jgi:hypothetical protein